jgi:hypothetical protein
MRRSYFTISEWLSSLYDVSKFIINKLFFEFAAVSNSLIKNKVIFSIRSLMEDDGNYSK